MPFGHLRDLIGQMRRLASAPERSGLDDAQLLERWVQWRDEAAFEVLLWRHGPLVLGVCRRLLRDSGDVEDAFQATFLTLLRKAASIRRRESAAAWLYRVAYRIAMRAGAAQRHRPERLVQDVPVASDDDPPWSDLRPVLDEEVNGLPPRYRTAFVLCYLQGKTNAEAAAEIGCPVGTVMSRLSWARQRLRLRLIRRGVTLSAALLGVVLAEKLAVAAAPAALVRATFQAGLTFASGGAVSAKVLTLTREVLRAMTLAKLKTAAVAVGVTAVLLGVGLLTFQGWAADSPGVAPRSTAPAGQRAGREDDAVKAPRQDYGAPSLHDGLLLVVGTELKEGEKCDADREVKVKVGDTTRRFRKLKVGDKVEAGQQLGLIDPSLTLDDVAIRQSRVAAAKAEFEAAEKVRASAADLFNSLAQLKAQGAGVVTDSEVRGAKLASEKANFDSVAKREAVRTAELELNQAMTILRSHEVRTGVNGVITDILYRPGEAVKKFDPVVRIKVAEDER